MPSSVALITWLVLLVALLLWDPAKEPKTSPALWVPLIWIFIAGSRLPGQWLGGEVVSVQAQAFEEGNPIDRTVFLVLIVLALGILVSRSFKWGDFFVRNTALVALVSFALVSVLWSDFPFISFKRWFRDFGNYAAILVVLSDRRPLEAVRTVLRRLCYLLIPLCVLLIKYFPSLGKQYSDWTGAGYYVGATTGKNMLGAVAMIGVIYFFWDTLTRWSDRREGRTKRIVMVNIVFIAMALWLMNLAHSATSGVCTVIGCVVILAARSRWAKSHPSLFRFLIPAGFCLYIILAFGLDLNGELARQVGRDPTLTDRTGIWKLVLSMHTNPLVGTGYESFWLGPRLQQIWKVFGQINESHNGYLEVYLNLGLIGVFFLVWLIIASYRNICRQFTSAPALASLNMAFWTMMLFYNMTEAAFKAHLMWDMFLLAVIAVPVSAESSVRVAAPLKFAGARPRPLGTPLRDTSSPQLRKRLRGRVGD
jgi:O-antigen ligase